MISPHQLRVKIIRPVLKGIGMYSKAAENLLMGTAAQESHMGSYLAQLGDGPALGIFQMEPDTHADILINWLYFRPETRSLLLKIVGAEYPVHKNLLYNLAYAAAFARLQYYRRSEPLPHEDDVAGMARYWKKYYNSYLGKGTVQEFIDNYEKYVRG